MNGVAMSRDGSFQAFINKCCVITQCDDDYAFTSDLFTAYQAFAQQNSGYVFSGYNAFSKFVNSQLSGLKHGRKYRTTSNCGKAESCYLGIRIV
jgi:hypothetical protein